MKNLNHSFETLLNEMDLFDLYQKDDQVGIAVNDLKESIEEEKKFKYGITVSNTINPNENSMIMAKVMALGDAYTILSALNQSVVSAPLIYKVITL